MEIYFPHPGSVFKSGWLDIPSEWDQPHLSAEFQAIRSVRDICNKALDLARSDKAIGGSLEAELLIHTNSPSLFSLLSRHENAPSGSSEFPLRDILIVSGLSLSSNPIEEASQTYEYSEDVNFEGEECKVHVAACAFADSAKYKCPRCWKFTSDSANSPCTRCNDSLKLLDQ